MPDTQDATLTEFAELQKVHDLELAEGRAKIRAALEAHERVFGAKVKLWRLERGWSQEQLAGRLRDLGIEMHQTTVAKLETGRRPVRLSEAFAVATAFRVPLLSIFHGPVPGEPWSLKAMRERLERLDESIAGIESNLETMFKAYADYQADRLRLAAAMNEAAVAHERPEPASPETTRDVIGRLGAWRSLKIYLGVGREGKEMTAAVQEDRRSELDELLRAAETELEALAHERNELRQQLDDSRG